MQKFHLLVVTLFVCLLSYGQADSLSKTDKALLDSMMSNDAFLKLMDEKAKNSFDVSIGIGNGAFSSHNAAANATGVSNQIIFTPSVLYRLKSGFSFGITGYITADSAKKQELYQTGLNAGYDYYGKKLAAGVSYTRFLSDKNKYNTKSVYQNDLYGYIKRTKGVLQPGIAVGFSNGNYKEANYVKFKRTIRLFNPLRDTTITVTGIDSTDNKTSYFSVSGNVEHSFSFYNVFHKDDEFDFVPSLIVNCGSDQITQTHSNKLFDRPKFSQFKKQQASNKFQLQSVAASFDGTYGIGKFFLQASLYLDYYLPETTGDRLSAIFSASAGFSF